MFPVQDGLGSVRGVVDNDWPDLDVLGTRRYAPYGSPFGVEGTMSTAFGFTGEMTDENALVFLRARYLNPSLGIFTSLDPVEGEIRRAMSLNGYNYVLGNPANLFDPSGQCDPITCAILLALGLLLAGAATGCQPHSESTPASTPPPAWMPTPAIAITMGVALATLTPDFTPRPTPAYTLSATATPAPTPGFTLQAAENLETRIPTPSPADNLATQTPTPQDLFRLPVDNAVVTPYGCNWVNSNNSPLRSRDVNPANEVGMPVAVQTNAYPPVTSEVMIVARNAPNNGNFVAIRINLANHTDLAAQIGVPGGYLYIGYSHLSSISVNPGQSISANTPIGITGQTGGGEVEGVHLDIMAFAINRV